MNALWGCSQPIPPPPTDVEVYASVLDDRRGDPAEAMALCDGLADPGTRGDCQLVVARRAVGGPKADPTTWCERVTAGVWRHECYFEAAESLRRRDRPQEAAVACLSAGNFANDCAQHLWQTPVHQLYERAARFSHIYEDALAIYAGWAPLLEADTDLHSRFWSRFWEQGFLLWGRDSAICEGLPDEPRAACVAASEIERPAERPSGPPARR